MCEFSHEYHLKELIIFTFGFLYVVRFVTASAFTQNKFSLITNQINDISPSVFEQIQDNAKVLQLQSVEKDISYVLN